MWFRRRLGLMSAESMAELAAPVRHHARHAVRLTETPGVPIPNEELRGSTPRRHTCYRSDKCCAATWSGHIASPIGFARARRGSTIADFRGGFAFWRVPEIGLGPGGGRHALDTIWRPSQSVPVSEPSRGVIGVAALMSIEEMGRRRGGGLALPPGSPFSTSSSLR